MSASAAAVAAKIGREFADAKYPGDARLIASDEGSEPDLVERDFKGKTDWRSLPAEFLDQSPDGFSTALAFLSDEAFCFYLPAYLIADLGGLLKSADPAFHLTHGFTHESKSTRINPRRFGEMTRHDYAVRRCSGLTAAQAGAIVDYLELKSLTASAFDKGIIDQALTGYWRKRATL